MKDEAENSTNTIDSNTADVVIPVPLENVETINVEETPSVTDESVEVLDIDINKEKPTIVTEKEIDQRLQKKEQSRSSIILVIIILLIVTLAVILIPYL